MNEIGEVKTALEGGVATISFHHPKGNSLPRSLLAALEQNILAVGADENVKVVVLKSEGSGSFCAGASFDELCLLREQGEAESFFLGFYRVMMALIGCPVPVVARVQGKFVGGGVGLVAACDYTVGSVHAAARLSEVSIGLGPLVVGPVVEHKIGVAHFGSMMFGTKWHLSDWCQRCGLLSLIVDGDEHDLDRSVEEVINSLKSSSRAALQASKRLWWSRFEYQESEAYARAATVGALALTSECHEKLATLR